MSTRRRKPFKGEYRDERGRRFRKWFATAEEAIEFKQAANARKLAIKLGRAIANGKRKNPASDREVIKLVRECSRLTRLSALGKMLPASITNSQAIGA